MWAKRIEKIFMQLLGVILSIAFLFPIYVLAINSFKPLRDIYKNAINFPETWSVENYIKAFCLESLHALKKNIEYEKFFDTRLYNKEDWPIYCKLMNEFKNARMEAVYNRIK